MAGVSELVGSVATYAVVATLLAACTAHVVHPRVLPRALAAHRVLPVPAAVAVVVTSAEAALGGAGAVAVLRERPGALLVVALAGAAGLLTAMGAYAWFVVATGRVGSCGCSSAELPMTGWVVARASALAGLALMGLGAADAVLPLARPGADLLVALLAAATFGCLLWQLPAAMLDPLRPAASHVPVPEVGR